MCGLCHLVTRAELTLLTALPGQHTECTDDILEGEAALGPAHPNTAENFPMNTA